VSLSTDGVTNWMHLFRWIVKLIRDEYGVDEAILTRTAVLETDCGLSVEQLEQVLDYLQEGFSIRFPSGLLDQIVRLEELCLVAAWLKGFYKKPDFIVGDFEAQCRSMNPGAQ
jgi:hypothetical protein